MDAALVVETFEPAITTVVAPLADVTSPLGHLSLNSQPDARSYKVIGFLRAGFEQLIRFPLPQLEEGIVNLHECVIAMKGRSFTKNVFAYFCDNLDNLKW
ncbi:hypothetical protein AMTR_s00031p00056270 [Amborella trichopoda]|uniref:Uncharacterized protein n=1 Tax=Amborella trichopoda TaxID=13333 RepID=U5CTB1_AMBTC|nr:hypothetical protein AMTR_s00031p00056270 [Amborella trichopoda]